MASCVGCILVGEDDGVGSKGVWNDVSSTNSKFERLDDGLVEYGDGTPVILDGIGVRLVIGSGMPDDFFVREKRPELSLACS